MNQRISRVILETKASDALNTGKGAVAQQDNYNRLVF